jgi:hypothetical protein
MVVGRVFMVVALLVRVSTFVILDYVNVGTLANILTIIVPLVAVVAAALVVGVKGSCRLLVVWRIRGKIYQVVPW